MGERFSLEELTVNYRTPEAVASVAAAVARAAGQDVAAPRAVREGEPPIIAELPAQADDAAIMRAIDDQLEEELEVVQGGLVAVIAPEDRVREIGRHLAERLPGRVGAGVRRLEHQVVVLSTWDAKGLEFDRVVLVEPSAIAAAEPDERKGFFSRLVHRITTDADGIAQVEALLRRRDTP